MPGTFSSFAALLIFLIPGFDEPYIIFPAIIIFFFLGISLGNKFEKAYGKDPSKCTVDELIGTWIALLYIPKEPLYIGMAFVLWRISDIIKIYPANIAENLEGGLGIMLDDVISAIYSLILSHIFIYILTNLITVG